MTRGCINNEKSSLFFFFFSFNQNIDVYRLLKWSLFSVKTVWHPVSLVARHNPEKQPANRGASVQISWQTLNVLSNSSLSSAVIVNTLQRDPLPRAISHPDSPAYPSPSLTMTHLFPSVLTFPQFVYSTKLLTQHGTWGKVSFNPNNQINYGFAGNIPLCPVRHESY